MRRRSLWCLLFCCIHLCGCGKISSESELIPLQEIGSNEEADSGGETNSNKEMDDAEENNKTDSIFVYVCGAVVQEGVYELPSGSRVYEAVEKAGGFTEDAARTQVNQAEILEDEARLYIPTEAEAAEEQAPTDGKVNINTASKEDLMTLPGVGESKASQIIQYRETHGAFQKIEDVMKISGIKEGLFNQIKDDIKI